MQQHIHRMVAFDHIKPHPHNTRTKIRFLAGLVRAAKAQLREREERYRIHNKTIDLVLDAYSVSGKPPVDREKLENYLRRSQRKPRKK
jgi:hypothetical protein